MVIQSHLKLDPLICFCFSLNAIYFNKITFRNAANDEKRNCESDDPSTIQIVKVKPVNFPSERKQLYLYFRKNIWKSHIFSFTAL